MRKARMYVRYHNQVKPQPVYLKLALDSKKVWYDYDPETGGAIPADEYHGIVQTVRIPSNIDCDAMDEALEHPEVKQLIETVFENGETYRDRNGNLRGKLTEEGHSALYRLEDWILDNVPRIAVWEASEWLKFSLRWDQEKGMWYLENTPITPETLDQLEEYYEDTRDPGIEVHGLREYLERLAGVR